MPGVGRTSPGESEFSARASLHDTIPPYTICSNASCVPKHPVTHTLKGKTKLLNRVRRIKGQVEAIERALEAEADCADVMQQITSCRGAVNGLLAELLEEHITSHFSNTPANKEASEQLLDVVHSYFK